MVAFRFIISVHPFVCQGWGKVFTTLSPVLSFRYIGMPDESTVSVQIAPGIFVSVLLVIFLLFFLISIRLFRGLMYFAEDEEDEELSGANLKRFDASGTDLRNVTRTSCLFSSEEEKGERRRLSDSGSKM